MEITPRGYEGKDERQGTSSGSGVRKNFSRILYNERLRGTFHEELNKKNGQPEGSSSVQGELSVKESEELNKKNGQPEGSSSAQGELSVKESEESFAERRLRWTKTASVLGTMYNRADVMKKAAEDELVRSDEYEKDFTKFLEEYESKQRSLENTMPGIMLRVQIFQSAEERLHSLIECEFLSHYAHQKTINLSREVEDVKHQEAMNRDEEEEMRRHEKVIEELDRKFDNEQKEHQRKLSMLHGVLLSRNKALESCKKWIENGDKAQKNEINELYGKKPENQQIIVDKVKELENIKKAVEGKNAITEEEMKVKMDAALERARDLLGSLSLKQQSATGEISGEQEERIKGYKTDLYSHTRRMVNSKYDDFKEQCEIADEEAKIQAIYRDVAYKASQPKRRSDGEDYFGSFDGLETYGEEKKKRGQREVSREEVKWVMESNPRSLLVFAKWHEAGLKVYWEYVSSQPPEALKRAVNSMKEEVGDDEYKLLYAVKWLEGMGLKLRWHELGLPVLESSAEAGPSGLQRSKRGGQQGLPPQPMESMMGMINFNLENQPPKKRRRKK